MSLSIDKTDRGREIMAKYNTKVLGFGDNVVDLYEHSHMMYPGGNCVNLCAYSQIFGVAQ